MKKWKSIAEWDSCHGFENNITTDYHHTKEAAEAVCRMLERDGLGGEHRHFPVKTRTEEIEEPDTEELSWRELMSTSTNLFPWQVALNSYVSFFKITDEKLLTELKRAFYIAHIGGRNYMYNKQKEEQNTLKTEIIALADKGIELCLDHGCDKHITAQFEKIVAKLYGKK